MYYYFTQRSKGYSSGSKKKVNRFPLRVESFRTGSVTTPLLLSSETAFSNHIFMNSDHSDIFLALL